MSDWLLGYDDAEIQTFCLCGDSPGAGKDREPLISGHGCVFIFDFFFFAVFVHNRSELEKSLWNFVISSFSLHLNFELQSCILLRFAPTY